MHSPADGRNLFELQGKLMPEEKEESSGFKVVDRRLFSEDGKMRQGALDSAKDPAPAPKTARAPTAPVATSPLENPEGDFGGFEGVVQFLGTTALFQLGLMQGPSGENIPTDLVSARHTIQMLEVLDHKTRGNLTPEETKLLEDVLYELRMSYVELEKRQAKKSR
jgi:Domain of unknown function (DUF1844)